MQVAGMPHGFEKRFAVNIGKGIGIDSVTRRLAARQLGVVMTQPDFLHGIERGDGIGGVNRLTKLALLCDPEPV